MRRAVSVSVLRFVLCVALLYALRWFVLSKLEELWVLEGMFGAMVEAKGVFDLDFTTGDVWEGHCYNASMWAAAVGLFLIVGRRRGAGVVRTSLAVFLLLGVFFGAVTAIYMNHLVEAAESFFLWSVVDAALLFPLMGLLNGLYWWLTGGLAEPAG